MREISEHQAELDGHLVNWRSAPSDSTPVLWLHGVPDSSGLWLDFLAQAGGIAPDLPGFGRSGKRADFPYSIEGYADFLEAFCDHLGLDRIRLVMHDWGAVGFALAQRRPELIEKLVAIDVVPFVPGYRWHRVARVWRTRGLGEFAMGVSGPLLRRGVPEWRRDDVLEHFDHGTQRAILRLYRASPPAVLAAAGERLDAIGAPALVLWGERDPYISPAYGEELVRRLPNAEFAVVSELGHWTPLKTHTEVCRVLAFVN